MAYKECCKAITVIAAAALTGKNYHFAAFDNAGKVNVVSSSGGAVDGIIGHPAEAADRAATMVVPDGGVAMVILGATVTAGAKVMSDANGKAITATAGNPIYGVALEAGAADEVVPVQFNYKGDAA